MASHIGHDFPRRQDPPLPVTSRFLSPSPTSRPYPNCLDNLHPYARFFTRLHAFVTRKLRDSDAMVPRLAALFFLALFGAFGCRTDAPKPTGDDPSRSAPAAAPPDKSAGPAASATPTGAPITVIVAYGSEKKSWIEESVKKFESSGALAGGRRVHIDARAMGSGEAVASILSGELKPHV